jgi:hypothetical protein
LHLLFYCAILTQVYKKIIIVLVILVLIGTGGYLVMKKPPQLNNQAPTAQNEPETATNATIQGTLKSLLTAGKSQKCTYSDKPETTSAETTSVEGTVYVANGKMRGDFSSTSEQIKVNGHMIADGEYSYVWSDLDNQGIKMLIDQQESSNAPTDTNTQTPDINQSYTFNCQGWTQDNTMFVPPSNITFSTFTLPSGLPSVAPPTDTDTNQSACAACDSIPAGEARNACKTQLNCK